MNRLLLIGSIALLSQLQPTPLSAANTDAGGYEVIANAFGFGVDIPGCADASKNIREISIDELNIDAIPRGNGPNGVRLYGPGQAHWGNAKFTSACTLGGSKELQAWWQEAAKGKGIRKNITVTLYKSDKSPGRSYSLLGCIPVAWTVAPGPNGRGEVLETVTVQPNRIAFIPGIDPPTTPGSTMGITAEATSSDKFAQVRGFKVDIANAGGKEVDSAWESVSGGEMIIELTETTIGADKFQTNSPGHKSVGEITLRGAMTDGRKALCDSINDTVNGKPWKRTLTITELLSVDGSVKDGKQYIYQDCFPCRYVFPRMSVTNTTGNTMEEVILKSVYEEDLPNKTLGRIAIDQSPEASKAALAVDLDYRTLDTSLLSSTGNARDMSAEILIPMGPSGASSELFEWYKQCAAGKGIRKNITVTLYKNKKSVGTLTLYECLATDFNSPGPAGFDTSSTVQTETIAVKPIRVELK